MHGRVFQRVICLLCALAVLAAGWALLPERREPVSQADREAQKRADAFRGTLSVWHVNGWRTGGTSAANLITQALTEMERQNSGVYFSLETLTVQQAQQRMVQGDLPDILSFPGGMTLPSEASWQSLRCTNLLECYSSAMGDTGFFLPWMASDAMVMIRNTSLSACGITAPQEKWTMEEFCALADTLTYQTQGRNAQTVYGAASGQGRWPQLSLFGVAEEAQLPGTLTEREAWNQLVEGNVSMLLAGPWEAMTLAWRLGENRGPNLTVLPWPSDAPVPRSVQWIGCRKSGDEKKDALCQKTVNRLLSETMQKKVADQAGCLPVIRLEEYPQFSAGQRSLVYALPGRRVTISEKWSENCSWGSDSGVYLWKP